MWDRLNLFFSIVSTGVLSVLFFCPKPLSVDEKKSKVHSYVENSVDSDDYEHTTNWFPHGISFKSFCIIIIFKNVKIISIEYMKHGSMMLLC
jgi:hypothetical protein